MRRSVLFILLTSLVLAVPIFAQPGIVIDANKDAFYGTLTGPDDGYIQIPYTMYNANGGPTIDEDLSAQVWTAWDDTYFYLYEEVKDDTVQITNVTGWQNDGLELKFDPDLSKKATTGVVEVSLTALDTADVATAYWAGINNLYASTGFSGGKKGDYARRRTADGYALELRLKWASMATTTVPRGPIVPAVGGTFGMALNQHDNDKLTRQASIQWAAVLDDAVWSNPTLHGTVEFLAGNKLKLMARNSTVPTNVNADAWAYVPGADPWRIAIDARRDPLYNQMIGPDDGRVHIPFFMHNDDGEPDNNKDLSADLWVAWDPTYLYFYEEVVDNVVHLNNPTSYQDDCLEVYLDPDLSKAKTSGQLGFHMTALDSAGVDSVNWPGVTNLLGYNCGLGSKKTDYARAKTANGYILEGRVKWDSLKFADGSWGPLTPAIGKSFGMSTMNHDNDVAAREASISWAAVLQDAVWNNPRLHGTVTFEADHKLKMVAENSIVPTNINANAWAYVPGTDYFDIAIDGAKDPWYNDLAGPDNGFVVLPSAVYNGNGAPRDNKDLSAKIWTAWDDTYFYLYEEVQDDTVQITNVTNWQNDVLELKFDPDPSKKASSGVKEISLTAVDSSGTVPAYYAGVANLTNATADTTDYARAKIKGGYALELRLKWSDIAVSGRGPVVPAVGNVFGMAINQHDNDKLARQASIEWAAKLDDAVWSNPKLHGKVTFAADHQLKMEAKNAIVDTLVNPLAVLYIPSGMPDPWLTMDIGKPAKAGKSTYDATTKMYSVVGGGADIWGAKDQFNTAFQQVSGDVDITAKVESLTKSDPWTKAGLMIRDELTEGSVNACMAIASDNGLTFQYRTKKDSLSANVAGATTIRPPYWLKLQRLGSELTGQVSADGKSWSKIGTVDLANMKDPVYVGMAVTSHLSTKVSTGVFSNVALKFTKITDVEETAASNVAPDVFALSQNYPNPFNPTTRFSYDIPKTTRVKIVIYDVLGREVETLVDGMKPAGRYTIEFNASRLSSGLYFCNMQYDKQRITRKMMLLK
jgi:hypothetical protein